MKLKLFIFVVLLSSLCPMGLCAETYPEGSLENTRTHKTMKVTVLEPEQAASLFKGFKNAAGYYALALVEEGCDARAFVMAWGLREKGINVAEIHIHSSSGQLLQGLWNFHVAIVYLERSPSLPDPIPMVIDPVLFTGPVSLMRWKESILTENLTPTADSSKGPICSLALENVVVQIDYPFSKFENYKGDEPSSPTQIADQLARGELWQLRRWAELKRPGVDMRGIIHRDRIAEFTARMSRL